MELKELLLSPDYTNVLVAYQLMQHMEPKDICDALIATADEAVKRIDVLTEKLITINSLVKVVCRDYGTPYVRLYQKFGMASVLIHSGTILIRADYDGFFKLKASVITVDGKTTYDINDNFKQHLLHELTGVTD